MKLGILVNTDRHREHVIGIARAAVARGHSVLIFMMDSGTRLIDDPGISALCGLGNVEMSFCSFNAKNEGVMTDRMPREMIAGSQLNNAAMNHAADRVIVL